MKHTLLVDVEAESAEAAAEYLDSVIGLNISSMLKYDLEALVNRKEAARVYYRKCIDDLKAMQKSIRPAAK